MRARGDAPGTGAGHPQDPPAHRHADRRLRPVRVQRGHGLDHADVAAIGAALAAGAAFASAATARHQAARTASSVNPSNFVRHVTNPYYPLKPGTVLVYKGVRDGQTQKDRVGVTYRTRKIEGVTATV